MGGIRRVRLKFPSCSPTRSGIFVFRDGQQITAVVEVEVAEPSKVRNVRVEIEGIAKCRWKSGNTTYHGNMVYLNESVIVWQPGTPNELLTVGTHHWEFTFRLPSGLPSSCVIDCGSVAYKAEAIVDIPWAFNSTHTVPFGVVKRIEVNTTQLRRSVSKAAEKTLCCCCCAKGPIKLAATINKLGFCNGDQIELRIVAENQTDRDLGHIKVSLVRQGVGQVRNNRNPDTRVVHVGTTQEVLSANGTLSVASFKMPVRNLGPSVAAQVVLVQYYVKVEIEVPWGLNCCVKFDVVIGTVDTSNQERQNVENLVGTLLREAGRRAHIQQAARTEGLSEVHEPPPAYADATAKNPDQQRLLSAMYD